MRLLHEPLLHFALIGFVLFVFYGRVASHDEDQSRIVVTQPLIDTIVRQYQATWMRPPTTQELEGLIDTYVRDEILYREGRTLGLDRDDPVVKRRVRQKLEVMAEEISTQDAADDAELDVYLRAHPEQFRQPAVATFTQILLPAGAVERSAAAARAALDAGADPTTLGQPTLLPTREERTPLDAVAKTFGVQFAAQIETIDTGVWVGPLESGFGAHLVRVDERTPAQLPPLADVRTDVAREWESERRRRALDDNYRRLRDRYTVVIARQATATTAQ